MDKKSQTVATYDATAHDMAQKFRASGARVMDIEKALELIKKPNPNVVEIGCGDGRDAKEIVKRTTNYLGVDISESMVALAREYVPEGKFEVVDVEQYQFPHNTDLIISFASLLHSDKQHLAQILSRAHGALRDGGIFYISLKYGTYREEEKSDRFGIRTFYYYLPEDIEELGKNYSVIWQDIQELRGQTWFTIVLRKLSQ